MGLADWLRRGPDRPRWDGTTGAPRSSNGASSFHLFWDAPGAPAGSRWVGAEATLEIVDAPIVPKLYFWALQVTMTDAAGRDGGGAHFGLQWITSHPGGTAVNWGGYRSGGGELDGSRSALPSGAGNVNTRDYTWRAHRPYRLRVVLDETQQAPDGLRAWRGEVTDLETGVTTIVRHLWAAGDRVSSPMVWSEVFADCDDPAVVVRWTDLALLAPDGSRGPVDAVSINYQAPADGGCTTTDTAVEGGAFVQRTATSRRSAGGARLRLG